MINIKIVIGNKGVIITTKIMALVVVILASFYFLGQQQQFPGISVPSVEKPTTITSTQEASKKIISMSATIEDIGSLLEDIDKNLG